MTRPSLDGFKFMKNRGTTYTTDPNNQIRS